MKRIRQISSWIIALAGLISTTSAWADSEPPRVSNNKLTLTSTKNSITVQWEMATDNNTSKEDISYFVYVRSSPSNSYVAQFHVSGRLKNTSVFTSNKYRDNNTSYDLKPGTTYYVYVRAYDKNDANYLEYQSGVIKTKDDTEAPKAGCDGKVTIGTVTSNSATVSWCAATDNVTPSSQLEYSASLIAKGIFVSGGVPRTKNITSYTLTGLSPNTEYEMRLFVFDLAENNIGYQFIKFTTKPADTEKPKAGCNGKITIGTVTTNSIALSWCKATDNVTPHSRMKYTYTYAEGFDKAGFPVKNHKTGTAITSGTITGLKPGTKYSVWVFATDEAGNYNFGTNSSHIRYHSVNVETKKSMVKVTSVTLDRNQVTINGDYEEIQLSATVAPSDATDQSLTWTSDNPEVASVDGNGLVTIHKKGKATISAKANDGSGKSDTCLFDVLTTVGNNEVSSLRIYAADGALHLTLPKAETTDIYHVDGAMVKTLALPSGDHVLPLPSGVYVVRVGERVTKVMVK